MDLHTISFINYMDSIDFENLSTSIIVDKIIECKYKYYDINSYKTYYEKMFYYDKSNELNKLKYIIVLCLWSKHDNKIDIIVKFIEKYKNKLFDTNNFLIDKINNLSL